MSKFISGFIAASLVSSLLISCSGAPSVQGPTGPTQSSTTTVSAPSQDQLKALQAKIAEDDTFVANLEKDPKAALKTQGINLAASEQIKLLKLEKKIFLILDDRNLQTFHANLLNASESEKSDLQKKLDVIRVKANSDANFKTKLLSNTAETLKAEGLDPAVAGLFEVVDYQPNTSLLLLASENGEINRGVKDDLRNFFSGIGGAALEILSDAMTVFINVNSSVTVTTIRATAATMVAGSGSICGITLGTNKFACSKTQGLSLSYWETNITNYLKAKKIIVPVN